MWTEVGKSEVELSFPVISARAAFLREIDRVIYEWLFGESPNRAPEGGALPGIKLGRH